MDWQKKLTYLQENNLSIYVEKDGEIIYQSNDPMLKPLLSCLIDRREQLAGATVVDKIVGRAAALLMTMAQVGLVLTPLASEAARQVFASAGVPFHAERMIPFITNRDHTDMCPMEKMAIECATAEEFFFKLRGLLKL